MKEIDELPTFKILAELDQFLLHLGNLAPDDNGEGSDYWSMVAAALALAARQIDSAVSVGPRKPGGQRVEDFVRSEVW